MLDKIPLSLPFFLAATYYLLYPFFSSLSEKRIIDYLDRVRSEWQGQSAPFPQHLQSQSIAQLVDWIADAPQLVPTILLPLAGILFAVEAAPVVAAGVVMFSALFLAAGALWIYQQNPIRYRSRRIARGRYTIVAAIGAVFNVAAGLAVLILPLAAV